MSIGFFTRRSPGVLISRITNDIEALNQLVSGGVVTMFSSTLTLLGAVVIMLALDLKLALVTFLTFPLLAVASLAFRIASQGAYRATRERIAAVTAYLQETLSGVRVVRSFGQEPRHAAAMTELNEANREVEHEDRLPQRLLLPGGRTARRRRHGGDPALRGDPGDRRGDPDRRRRRLRRLPDRSSSNPIQELSQLYTTYQQGMAALDKIFDLLDTEPDMVDAPGAIDPGRCAARSRWRGSGSPTEGAKPPLTSPLSAMIDG